MRCVLDRICYGKDMVGFFILQWGDIQPYSCDEDALLLRAYSIQQQYQGQGFAKQSMHELPVFVNGYFPDVRKVVLGVNRKNKLAQKVYLAGGFEDTGRRVEWSNYVLGNVEGIDLDEMAGYIKYRANKMLRMMGLHCIITLIGFKYIKGGL